MRTITIVYDEPDENEVWTEVGYLFGDKLVIAIDDKCISIYKMDLPVSTIISALTDEGKSIEIPLKGGPIDPTRLEHMSAIEFLDSLI